MAQFLGGKQVHADDSDGDALRLSPQAAQQDRSHSCTTCQRLRTGGDIYPRRCFECTTEYDPDGQVLPDRQKRLRDVGPSSRPPQAVLHQNTTLAAGGLLNTQDEGSVSVVSLREHTRMSEQGARATKDTDIDASLISSLVDPPSLPVTREAISGVSQTPTVPPPRPYGFVRWAGNSSNFGLNDGSGFGQPSFTSGPPPNAPTGPRSTRKASQYTSAQPYRVSSPPRALPQPLQELKAKRGFDHLTSRSPSPSHVRIKLEEESSPDPEVSGCSTGSNSNARDTTEDNGRYFDPILDAVPVRLGKASRVTSWDPQGNRVGWQILCLGEDFGRRRICGYLCFSDTAQMRIWEESDPKRWKYIRTLSSLTRIRIDLTDVLRIICNDGGALATVAAYMESLEPWVCHVVDHEDFKHHTVTVGATSRIGVGPPHPILRVVMAIVWLIRSSPAQFRGSGTFDTPYFWYAPEDVSRAYWYLNNLRCNPHERGREGTKSAQLARQPRTGTDAGLSSLHNSVSEGEWAGRFLRKDIVSKQEKIPEKQSEHTVRRGEKTNRWGEKTGQWRNKAEIRSEDIAVQLLRLRTWSYNTYSFSNPTDETELDRLMDLARLHTKPQTRNLDVYRSACMEVELFVWAKSHPHILNDRSKDTFADFKVLLSWLHARDIAVGDDQGVAGLIEEAVKAVVAADRGGYNGKKAEVKEMVYMADLGMGEVFTGC